MAIVSKRVQSIVAAALALTFSLLAVTSWIDVSHHGRSPRLVLAVLYTLLGALWLVATLSRFRQQH
jgi:hypothetical protein